MNITDEMVTAFSADWTAHDCGADRDCCTRSGLARVAPLIAAQALREAYWKLREHASGLRATEVYRKASERREGTLGESPAHQRYRWLEATARGIEDGARDLAELLGVPENEIERS
jgi:hypothetical protein